MRTRKLSLLLDTEGDLFTKLLDHLRSRTKYEGWSVFSMACDSGAAEFTMHMDDTPDHLVRRHSDIGELMARLGSDWQVLAYFGPDRDETLLPNLQYGTGSLKIVYY